MKQWNPSIHCPGGEDRAWGLDGQPFQGLQERGLVLPISGLPQPVDEQGALALPPPPLQEIDGGLEGALARAIELFGQLLREGDARPVPGSREPDRDLTKQRGPRGKEVGWDQGPEQALERLGPSSGRFEPAQGQHLQQRCLPGARLPQNQPADPLAVVGGSPGELERGRDKPAVQGNRPPRRCSGPGI